jgi:hypothetical protein
MSEYTHLVLVRMHEDEITQRLENRRRHGLPQRTPMRTRTARTLHRVADILDRDRA